METECGKWRFQFKKISPRKQNYAKNTSDLPHSTQKVNNFPTFSYHRFRSNRNVHIIQSIEEFHKMLILFAIDGYGVIITNSTLDASFAMYHLESNSRRAHGILVIPVHANHAKANTHIVNVDFCRPSL